MENRIKRKMVCSADRDGNGEEVGLLFWFNRVRNCSIFIVEETRIC